MLFHYQIRPQTTRSHIFAGASFTAGPAVLMFARSVLNSFTILTATSCVVAHFSLKTEAQLSTTLNARQTEHELLPSCMKSIELGPVKNNPLTTSSEASRDAFSAADEPKPHLTANLLLAVWIQFFGATLILVSMFLTSGEGPFHAGWRALTARECSLRVCATDNNRSRARLEPSI